jgi:hypothetical protein
MEFDKSKVYTALNAEELEVGSEVILANYLESLKDQVEANSWPSYVLRLDGVMGTSFTSRFKSGNKQYNLAYLISKPEPKCIVYLLREEGSESGLAICYEDTWERMKEIHKAKGKLFVGSLDEAQDWTRGRWKFRHIIEAWEDGKAIQCYDVTEDDWINVDFPRWDVKCRYRVKPEEDLYVAYVAYVDHYEPHLDFGPYAQWDKIQEY